MIKSLCQFAEEAALLIGLPENSMTPPVTSPHHDPSAYTILIEIEPEALLGLWPTG